MQEFSNTHLWRTRGYLPHYHASEKYQMITYRLADSIPQRLINEFKEEYKDKNLDTERRQFIEDSLDKSYGSCVLRDSDIAKAIIENWFHFHGERYDLVSFVVMPNHIHLLIKVYPNQSLSKIIHSWKSYTSNKIKELLASRNSVVLDEVWQKEYWDRFIRDEHHYNSAIKYIHNNPVKAGLVKSAENWKWSSANDKFVRAG